MRCIFLFLMFGVIVPLKAELIQELHTNKKVDDRVFETEYSNKSIKKRKPIDHITIKQKPIRGIRTLILNNNTPVYNRPTRQNLELLNKFNDCATYIDGVKIIGEVNIPLSSIDYISIMERGIPAEYGDFSFGRIERNIEDYTFYRLEN